MVKIIVLMLFLNVLFLNLILVLVNFFILGLILIELYMILLGRLLFIVGCEENGGKFGCSEYLVWLNCLFSFFVNILLVFWKKFINFKIILKYKKL